MNILVSSCPRPAIAALYASAECPDPELTAQQCDNLDLARIVYPFVNTGRRVWRHIVEAAIGHRFPGQEVHFEMTGWTFDDNATMTVVLSGGATCTVPCSSYISSESHEHGWVRDTIDQMVGVRPIRPNIYSLSRMVASAFRRHRGVRTRVRIDGGVIMVKVWATGRRDSMLLVSFRAGAHGLVYTKLAGDLSVEALLDDLKARRLKHLELESVSAPIVPNVWLTV
jgi:hypothetical protein